MEEFTRKTARQELLMGYKYFYINVSLALKFPSIALQESARDRSEKVKLCLVESIESSRVVSHE